MEDKKSSENASIKATIMAIYKDAPRVVKCKSCDWIHLTTAIVSIAKLKAETQDRQYGRAVKSARELVHTVFGKAWEDTASVFRQLDSIGPKAIAKLSAEGIHSESLMY